jgi:8-hydroxy-5-deazaflavin:NADPH oxidoreductase
LGANDLGAATERKPKRAVLFYATDQNIAAETVERLIRASGFESVKVGGTQASGRIELVGGDLHQCGGLKGKLVDLDEARSLF